MSNLVVQTNVLALNSHRNLKVVGNKQATASSRLSSGYRVNTAADDAAGLAISEKMRAQIRGLDMASKNTQDGISLVQTAEGGMQEIDNMIQRIRELAVQAANDTNDYSTNDRKKLQDEINQLTEGIDQMADQVEFNAKKLLDGSLLDGTSKAATLSTLKKNMLSIAGTSSAASGGSVATDSGQFNQLFSGGSNSLSALGAATATIVNADGSFTVAAPTASAVAAVASGNFNTFANAKTYLDSIDTYITAAQSRVDLGVSTGSTELEAAKKLRAAVVEAANIYAQYSAQGGVYGVVTAQSGTGLWFQTGANSGQGMQVGIGSIKSNVLGIGDGYGTSSVNVNKASGMEVSSFINKVESALQYVTAERARLGAVQNRLDFTKSSLEISSENLSASESRIRDADMAKEMMKLTAANVLQQAGVSMLAQANQAPQSVLQLLR